MADRCLCAASQKHLCDVNVVFASVYSCECRFVCQTASSCLARPQNAVSLVRKGTSPPSLESVQFTVEEGHFLLTVSPVWL